MDVVGKSSFGRCKRLLKPRGLYLSSDLGPLSQNPILALITPLLGGKKVRFPIPKQDQEMAGYFKQLLDSGAFKPLIDRRYRLDQILEAYRYVETGQKIGNVVSASSRRPREANEWVSKTIATATGVASPPPTTTPLPRESRGQRGRDASPRRGVIAGIGRIATLPGPCPAG